MSNIPGHVAIIMDGNGRWAQSRGLPRIAGHKEGILAVRRTVRAAVDCGVKYLTLYSFSTENWKRSSQEVNFLFNLMEVNLIAEMRPLHQENIRVRFAGRIDRLPEKLQEIILETEKLTCNNTGLNLTFAINYGGRQEIMDAIKKMVNARVNIDEKLDEMFFRRFFLLSRITGC